MNTTSLVSQERLQINSAALTDRGRQRALNEDAVYHYSSQAGQGENFGLYLVCDGLGGHQAGEVASRLAVETVVAELTELPFSFKAEPYDYQASSSSSKLRRRIEAAIIKAHDKIQGYAQTHAAEAADLGTTMVLALIYGDLVQITNVGDSRAYAWRSGQVTRLTEDHSLAAKLVKMGQIDERELAGHRWSSVLSQALGATDQPQIDLFDWRLQAGDRLLLCSDGVWKAFPDKAELAWWLGLEETPADLCWRLVLEANRRDGSDNLSAVVIRVDKFSSQQDQSLETRPFLALMEWPS